MEHNKQVYYNGPTDLLQVIGNQNYNRGGYAHNGYYVHSNQNIDPRTYQHKASPSYNDNNRVITLNDGLQRNMTYHKTLSTHLNHYNDHHQQNDSQITYQSLNSNMPETISNVHMQTHQQIMGNNRKSKDQRYQASLAELDETHSENSSTSARNSKIDLNAKEAANSAYSADSIGLKQNTNNEYVLSDVDTNLIDVGADSKFWH